MSWGRRDPLWFSLPARENDVGRREASQDPGEEGTSEEILHERNDPDCARDSPLPSPGAAGGQSAARFGRAANGKAARRAPKAISSRGRGK